MHEPTMVEHKTHKTDNIEMHKKTLWFMGVLTSWNLQRNKYVGVATQSNFLWSSQ
jgi:hypothetical protein